MYSALGPLCEALGANASDASAHRDIMVQYLNGLELDLGVAAGMANDEMFGELLHHVIVTLLRTPFPADSPVSVVQMKCLNFLTFMCANHPDLLSTIAAATPLDYLVPVFFERNVEGDKIVHVFLGNLLPTLQFLAALSCSSSINISSTSAMQLLFVSCVSCIGSPQLAPWAVATIAGFARNSSAALAYLKAMPNLAHLKREIAALLSAGDNSLVIAALAAVTALFQRGVDKETAMKVSVAVVVSPPPIFVATALAASVVLQMVDEVPLELQDVEQILQAATTASGMRAYILYKLLLECGGPVDGHLLQVLQNKTTFIGFVTSVLTCEDGFVTIAGTHLLTTLFENTTLPLEVNIEDSFATALKLVLSNKVEDMDRVEAMLLIMRLLIQNREAITHIVRLLQDNEESIFMAFQRHIESNHSFVALHFFLFIYSAAHFFKHWTLRLRELVVESQFSALIAHAVTSSNNRQTIHDALVVMHLVVTGIDSVSPDVDVSLFDTLTSGFYVMNRKGKQERATKDAEVKQIQNEYLMKMQELEVERDLSAKELQTLREQASQSQNQLSSDQEKITALEEQNEGLKKHLQSKKTKLAATFEALKTAETERTNLSLQLSHKEQETNDSIHKSEKLRTRVQAMKQVEVEKQSLERKCDQLEQKLQEVLGKWEEAKQDIDIAIKQVQKERTRRKDVEKLLQSTQERVNELAAQYDNERSGRAQGDRENQRLQGIVKQKTEHERLLADTIRQMKSELEATRQEHEDCLRDNNELKTNNQKLSKQLTDLRKKRKDLAALAQLIHRITDGKAENLDSLAPMIHNEEQM